MRSFVQNIAGDNYALPCEEEALIVPVMNFQRVDRSDGGNGDGRTPGDPARGRSVRSGAGLMPPPMPQDEQVGEYGSDGRNDNGRTPGDPQRSRWVDSAGSMMPGADMALECAGCGFTFTPHCDSPDEAAEAVGLNCPRCGAPLE